MLYAPHPRQSPCKRTFRVVVSRLKTYVDICGSNYHSESREGECVKDCSIYKCTLSFSLSVAWLEKVEPRPKPQTNILQVLSLYLFVLFIYLTLLGFGFFGSHKRRRGDEHTPKSKWITNRNCLDSGQESQAEWIYGHLCSSCLGLSVLSFG